MKLAQTTATTTTIDADAPTTFTCAQCPFARLIEDNRYCCQVSQTASDVKRGHWEATVSCYEALAKAEAEKAEPVAEIETAPIAQTPAPAPAPVPARTPATPTAATLSAQKTVPAQTPAPAKPTTDRHTATAAAIIPTPTAGTNDEPPDRGDNGRGRVQPIAAAKKLLPSLVSVKRISSDIPASNFDQFELEVLGELSLAIGGFLVPPVLVRHSGGYKVVSGHLQYHAAVLAKQLNPRAGETIPAIILEPENQATALAQLKRLKFAA